MRCFKGWELLVIRIFWSLGFFENIRVWFLRVEFLGGGVLERVFIKSFFLKVGVWLGLKFFVFGSFGVWGLLYRYR